MRVYIETTIPSYLTSWPSPQIVHAGHQISTHDWWNNHRQNYELYTSLVTQQEAASGDPSAAQRRLQSLLGIPLLSITPECEAIANTILLSGLIPAKADRDALHIGVATSTGSRKDCHFDPASAAASGARKSRSPLLNQ